MECITRHQVVERTALVWVKIYVWHSHPKVPQTVSVWRKCGECRYRLLCDLLPDKQTRILAEWKELERDYRGLDVQMRSLSPRVQFSSVV
jgi:hypothetical protein